jgi:hypothetical protein
MHCNDFRQFKGEIEGCSLCRVATFIRLGSLRLRAVSPLLCQGLVSQRFDVYAADYGSGLKSDLFAGLGVIPVGERNPSRAFADPKVDAVKDLLVGIGF